MDFIQIILSPFVWLLTFFYNFFGSYGIALILFVAIIKLVLLPPALKSRRSMTQMNILQGKIQELQKQYGRDRERYNLKVQKLYEREKVNPMDGCLWSLLPLLILIPLYAIIRQPIEYMMGINDVEIFNQVAQVADWNSITVSNGWIREAGGAFSNVGYNQLYLSSLITPENLEAVKATVSKVGSRISTVNFDLLDLVDLTCIPTLKFWTVASGFALFLLPVMSAGSSLVFSFISTKTNTVSQQAARVGNNVSMKSMVIISPLIPLWVGFSMLAAPCLYWIAQNLLSMMQEFICGKLPREDYEKAATARAEQKRLEKEEEREERRRKAEERARQIEEAKLNKDKKKKTEKKHDENKGKILGSIKEHSHVGLRQYARGRTYDPYRYSEEGPTTYPGEASVFPPKSDSHTLKREAHEIEEELRGIHADKAIEDAVLEEKVLKAPVQGETEVISAGGGSKAPYAEESETEDDTDKTRE